MKYLTADSLSQVVFSYTSIGKNPIIFSSKPPQIASQCWEEIENDVPKNIIKKNMNLKGRLESIKNRIKSNYSRQS